MKRSDSALLALGALSLIGIGLGLYMAFLYAPSERTMGEVQRIFYFHLPLAWVGFLAFAVVFICGVLYLATGSMRFDIAANSSAEIGMLFSTLVLVTGSLWARQAWNVWWTWDPRLTTMLILWLMYGGYFMIRKASEQAEKRARFSAVVGIVCFANVPIVFMSVRWWRSLHPLLITRSGFAMEPPMLATLMVCLGAFTILYAFFFVLRMRLGVARNTLDGLRLRIEEARERSGE